MQIIEANSVTDIAHLIQLSIAPVFLIAGVAGLLNVFTGRLIRIIDQVYKLDRLEEAGKLEEYHKKRRIFLTMRLQNINTAIFLSTATGLFIGLVIITMFLSNLLNFNGELIISSLFIISMLCLITALLVFLREIYFTTSFIKTIKKKIKKPKKED